MREKKTKKRGHRSTEMREGKGSDRVKTSSGMREAPCTRGVNLIAPDKWIPNPRSGRRHSDLSFMTHHGPMIRVSDLSTGKATPFTGCDTYTLSKHDEGGSPHPKRVRLADLLRRRGKEQEKRAHRKRGTWSPRLSPVETDSGGLNATNRKEGGANASLAP